MDRVCGMYGDERNPQRILVRKPDVNRPLTIPRLSGEYNIKINFKKVE
jgi:hypothetical protein